MSVSLVVRRGATRQSKYRATKIQRKPIGRCISTPDMSAHSVVLTNARLPTSRHETPNQVPSPLRGSVLPRAPHGRWATRDGRSPGLRLRRSGPSSRQRSVQIMGSDMWAELAAYSCGGSRGWRTFGLLLVVRCRVPFSSGPLIVRAQNRCARPRSPTTSNESIVR